MTDKHLNENSLVYSVRQVIHVVPISLNIFPGIIAFQCKIAFFVFR